MATIVLLKESLYKRPEVKVDFVGALVLGLSLALFVLGLSEGPSWGWTSAATLGALALGAALLLPLYLFEARDQRNGGEPILDLRLLGRRNVLVSNTVLGVAGLAMFLSLFSLSFRFELVGPASFGESIFVAGLSLVPMALAMLVFAPLAGFTVSRTGVKPQALLGGALGALGFLGVGLATTLPQIYGAEVLIGAGLAFLNASVVNFLVLSVEPRDMGLATSMNGVFRNLGSSIGAPIAGSILTTYLVAYSVPSARGPIALEVPGKEAFQLPFLIAAGMMVLAAALSMLGHEVLGPRAIPSAAARGVAPGGGTPPAGTPSPSH